VHPQRLPSPLKFSSIPFFQSVLPTLGQPQAPWGTCTLPLAIRGHVELKAIRENPTLLNIKAKPSLWSEEFNFSERPGIEPRIRLPAQQGICFSLCPSPLLIFSLSQINK